MRSFRVLVFRLCVLITLGGLPALAAGAPDETWTVVKIIDHDLKVSYECMKGSEVAACSKAAEDAYKAAEAGWEHDRKAFAKDPANQGMPFPHPRPMEPKVKAVGGKFAVETTAEAALQKARDEEALGPVRPEAAQVLVVANAAMDGSLEIANHYLERRRIPGKNLLTLRTATADDISRDLYQREILAPVQQFLKKAPGIRYVVLVYGVPLRVQDAPHASGETTIASVDSELVFAIPDLKKPHPLAGWIDTPFTKKNIRAPSEYVMVARLDGPSPGIAKALVDRALLGEREPLVGCAYIDQDPEMAAKGAGYATTDAGLGAAATLLRKAGMPVVNDNQHALMDLTHAQDLILYFGWYTGGPGGTFPTTTTFRPGSIGFHVFSFAASTIHGESWTSAMLAAGMTCCMGAVYEPYTIAYPPPAELTANLLQGYTIGESFYLSAPWASWQMVLVGDPLYLPDLRRYGKM